MLYNSLCLAIHNLSSITPILAWIAIQIWILSREHWSWDRVGSQPTVGHILYCKEETGEPTWTQWQHVKLHPDSNLKSGSNQGPLSCVAMCGYSTIPPRTMSSDLKIITVSRVSVKHLSKRLEIMLQSMEYINKEKACWKSRTFYPGCFDFVHSRMVSLLYICYFSVSYVLPVECQQVYNSPYLSCIVLDPQKQNTLNWNIGWTDNWVIAQCRHFLLNPIKLL